MSEEVTRLFHPRTDTWHEHFCLDGAILAGLTAIGRVTIQVLAMNNPEFVQVRKTLLDEGLLAG